MMRWIVNYIDENKEQWTVDKEIRQSENAGEISLNGGRHANYPMNEVRGSDEK